MDLYEPVPAEHDGPAEHYNSDARDKVLSDTKMFGIFRKTKWVVDEPQKVSFLSKIPKELLEKMTTENM